MKTTSIVVLAAAAALSLATAATAGAALPATPGVAFVNEGYQYDVGGYANFTGGPLTQNHITSTVSADRDTTTFSAPKTLMLPSPLDEAISAYDASGIPGTMGPAPKDGPEQECTYGTIGHISCDTYDACWVTVTGNVGNDTITVRYLASQKTVFTGPVPFTDKPCGFIVNGDRGNDTIDTRDGIWSHVICGGGFDQVRADTGDLVDRDCEVVRRG